MPMFHEDRLQALMDAWKDHPDMIAILRTTLLSFSEYHAAIFRMETEVRLMRAVGEEPETFREKTAALDQSRTNHHNTVLSQVGLMNRLAEKAGIPAVYDGEVSEKRPYRREVANAILAYVETVVAQRT